MAILTNYDPKQVTLSWNDININEGIAAGTFISVARTGARNSLNVGPDGNGSNVVNNDRSGVVTVTLRMGSAVNKLLTAKAKEQELENGSPSVGSLKLTDFSGETTHASPKGVLAGFPDDAFADTEGTRDWAFNCLELNMNPSGSLEL